MRLFNRDTGPQKGEVLVTDVYQNPQRTQTDKRQKGMPFERDVTMPPELMKLLQVDEDGAVIIRNEKNTKSVVAKVLNAPEELRVGVNRADVPHCFVTLGETLRKELGLEKESERKAKKFKLKYPKVYVRRK